MAGGDPEWAESLRQDEMREWARYAPGPRRRIDRGGLPNPEELPDRHEAEVDR